MTFSAYPDLARFAKSVGAASIFDGAAFDEVHQCSKRAFRAKETRVRKLRRTRLRDAVRSMLRVGYGSIKSPVTGS